MNSNPLGERAPHVRSPLSIDILIGGIALPAAFLFASWAYYAPHATFVEFARRAQGIVPIVVAALTFIAMPILVLIFRKSGPVREIADLARRRLRRKAFRIVSSLSIWIATLILIGFGMVARTKQTDFDRNYGTVIHYINWNQPEVAKSSLAAIELDGTQYARRRYAFAETAITVLTANWTNADSLIAEISKNSPDAVSFAFPRSLLLARVYEKNNEDEKIAGVIDSARKMAKTNSELCAANLFAAEWNYGSRRYGDAIMFFERATECSEDMPQATRIALLKAEGNCFYELGQWKHAADRFEAAIGNHPPVPISAILKSNLGFVLARDGKYDEAVSVLHESLELAQDSYTYINLALAYAEHKKWDDARNALQRSFVDRRAEVRHLARLTEAWVQLRQNAAWHTGVVEDIQKSNGEITTPKSVGAIVRSRRRVARLYLEAARQTYVLQPGMGLEFMASDFADAAQKMNCKEARKCKDDDLEREIDEFKRRHPRSAGN